MTVTETTGTRAEAGTRTDAATTTDTGTTTEACTTTEAGTTTGTRTTTEAGAKSEASTTTDAGTPPDHCAGPPRDDRRPDGADHYTISEVAALTGLSAHTLRWYERIGLMPHVDRSQTGRRRYSNRDLDWLGLVGKLRLTGMPVADMVRYAELVRAGDHTHPERLELLTATRENVRTRIAELRGTLALLDRKIDFYTDAGGAQAPATTQGDG
ncbi:MerR family transcriptional regulator [Streptomyces sp. NPDC029526]|uniref:MerR family transcriptional regulator n=1 Tax=Streptomyces sp. NPDC029526 TaxID=3155728 RepID=UPI0033D2AB17